MVENDNLKIGLWGNPLVGFVSLAPFGNDPDSICWGQGAVYGDRSKKSYWAAKMTLSANSRSPVPLKCYRKIHLIEFEED